MALSRLLFAVPMLLSGVAALNAQTLSAIGSGTTTTSAGDCHCALHHPSLPPQPYTAEFKTTQVQVLSNGVTITRVNIEKHAKDAQGRTYLEQQVVRATDRPLVTEFRVQDDSAGTDLSWNSESKTASLIRGPGKEEHHGCWATESGHMRWVYDAPRAPRPAITQTLAPRANAVPTEHEDLGTRTIEGVEAKGARITRTIPAGTIGNDGPLVSHIEFWTAVKLGLLLEQVIDDPQMGKSTRETTLLSLSDPDPALFQPPADYEVKTETAHQIPCPE
ncbi:hypothetical protein [Silvibacterium sp.]|uniref:hypothetical protein n=1 Tax=Silvibacterium sp. TaxID=1964179 RepID=UPI0039E23487